MLALPLAFQTPHACPLLFFTAFVPVLLSAFFLLEGGTVQRFQAGLTWPSTIFPPWSDPFVPLICLIGRPWSHVLNLSPSLICH